jgi:two-component system phosphate regulon response regulator PhoB
VSEDREARPHVLVVDDDELIRTIARAVIQKAGMRVSEAGDGAEALALLAGDEPFALVLLDLDMPKVGGMEVLRTIRTTRSSGELPVVVLSGAYAEEDELAVMQAGANAFFPKPLIPERLLAQVRSVLPK